MSAQSAAAETTSEVLDFTQKEQGWYVPARIKDLVLYKDPVFSGVAFGVFNLYFYLVAFGGYTFISLSLFLATVHLVVSVLFVTITGFIKQFQHGPQPPPTPNPVHLNPETVKKVSDNIVSHINCGLKTYSKVQSCQHAPASLLAILVLYLTAKFFSVFSGLTLLYIAGLVAFTVPMAYSKNTAVADKHLATAKAKLKEVTDQVMAKIPKSVMDKMKKTE